MATKRIGNIDINYTLPEAQTQMWDTLGRNAGMQTATTNNNDNFFAKRGKSLENAFGTTGAAVISGINDAIHSAETDRMLKSAVSGRDDIAKRYGYNNIDDLYIALDAAEANGDNITRDKLLRAEQEDRDFTSGNVAAMKQRSADYEDYRKNNYVSQKINQDPGKFAGSAINTLSTATDVLGLTNGPISNAIQGGIEGIADELEQNGLENFDWGRAGQNAAVGAASGAAVGALNKGVDKQLAKNGGNLFKGGNAVTRALNNWNQTSNKGKLLSTLGTGVARGAQSGLVGGAVGGGVSAALNNEDVLGNALQGAVQGAGQGAMAGGAMAGANMALNKTPGVGKFMQDVNQAQENWRNSGDNFNERFVNTLSSGDSTLGNTELGRTIGTKLDDMYSAKVNQDAKERLANALTESIANKAQGGVTGNTKFVRLTEDRLRDVNILREAQGLTPLEDRQVTAYENAINNGLIKRAKQGGMTAKDVANMAYESLMSPDAEALPGNYGTTNTMMVAPYKDRYNGSMVDNFEGTTSLKSIEPRSASKVATQRAIKNGLLDRSGSPLVANQEGGVTQTSSTEGSTSVGSETTPLRTLDSILPQTDQNVNRVDTLAYGESDLANRTRRGMIADGLERFGNTLEGAQTNITRAAAKDLGIESAGKVVENVRKKTGITNLETQAALAKELTGGENSLMDSVQRIALTASENGEPYAVDTTPVLKDVESIVNRYADTNMFGSQSAKDKFIRNLKTDISSYEGDVISIANRMKANAADLRGKGVASPTPADSAKAKIYTEVANRLDDLSYKAIPQENVDAMFETTISEMRGRANQASQKGNTDIAKAYNLLADTLEAEPRTIKAFRSFKKDFVDISKINELTARAENGAATQMGRSFSGGIKRFGSTLLQRPANAALAKAGGVLNSAADRVAKGSTPNTALVTKSSVSGTNPATNLYNVIGRTEGEIQGQNAAQDYIQQVEQATNMPSSESTAIYNALNGTGSQSIQGSSAYQYGTTASGLPSTGDYWTDIIGSAMMAAAADGNVDAFGQLYTMYAEAMSNATKSSSTSEVKLTDKQRQANAAERALNDFETAEHNFAYDVSDIPIIGGIANFGGNEYASKAEALALQIGYMLSGATVNKEEAKNIGMAYVPQPRDNEAVRNGKLAQIRGIISDYQKTYAE